MKTMVECELQKHTQAGAQSILVSTLLPDSPVVSFNLLIYVCRIHVGTELASLYSPALTMDVPDVEGSVVETRNDMPKFYDTQAVVIKWRMRAQGRSLRPWI